MIKTDLSGFVVTIHLGLYKQYVQSLGLNGPLPPTLSLPSEAQAGWDTTGNS